MTVREEARLPFINSSHPIRASYQNTAVLWRVPGRVRVRNIHGCARLLCDSTRGRGEGGWIPSATSMNEEGRDQMKAFDESMCHACPTTETTRQVQPRGDNMCYLPLVQLRTRQPSMQRAPARVRVAESSSVEVGEENPKVCPPRQSPPRAVRLA